MRQAALFASLALIHLALGPARAQESARPGTMTDPVREATSAASRARTGIANPWHRRRAPVTAPGVPT
jgi:hypothetical protein